MNRTIGRFIEKHVTVVFLLISLSIFVVGLLLTWIAGDESQWADYKRWQAAMREIGAFFMVSVALAVVWEMLGKREFMNEILEKTKISAELNAAGIIAYPPNYHLWSDWDQEFNNSGSLDIFAAYPVTWFSNYQTQLQQFVAAGRKIRVILADPNSTATVAEFAQRTDDPPTLVKSMIEKCHKDFLSLSTAANPVQVHTATGGHPVKFFLFDKVCVLATYSLRPQVDPAALVGKKGGNLYEYVRQEFDEAWKQFPASTIGPAIPAAAPQIPAEEPEIPAGLLPGV